MDEAPQDGVVHQDLPPAYNQGAAAPQAPTKPGPARSVTWCTTIYMIPKVNRLVLLGYPENPIPLNYGVYLKS